MWKQQVASYTVKSPLSTLFQEEERDYNTMLIFEVRITWKLKVQAT